MMDLSEIATAAERQGWRKKEVNKGWIFYPPDRTKSGVEIRRRPTEQALKKTVSQMRQRGFIWPPPTTGEEEGS
jgi:hypothetical protein